MGNEKKRGVLKFSLVYSLAIMLFPSIWNMKPTIFMLGESTANLNV
jgi:hypothetical protein